MKKFQWTFLALSVTITLLSAICWIFSGKEEEKKLQEEFLEILKNQTNLNQIEYFIKNNPNFIMPEDQYNKVVRAIKSNQNIKEHPDFYIQSHLGDRVKKPQSDTIYITNTASSPNTLEELFAQLKNLLQEDFSNFRYNATQWMQLEKILIDSRQLNSKFTLDLNSYKALQNQITSNRFITKKEKEAISLFIMQFNTTGNNIGKIGEFLVTDSIVLDDNNNRIPIDLDHHLRRILKSSLKILMKMNQQLLYLSSLLNKMLNKSLTY